MTREEQILDKALDIIEASMNGEAVNNNAVFTATELVRNGFSYLMNQRIEKERIRLEVWADNISEKEKGG